MDARVTQELLFPSTRGVMYSHSALQSTWRRASESAGVAIVPVREGTRHTSATYARREKWPLDLIQRFLGHANVKTTERYSRHHDGALVQLIRRER
jgi:integrase